MPPTKKTETSTSTAAEAAAPYSAEIVASNDNLLTEIHLRLPIKSLIKFQCVSKHWLSLISHPQFALLRSTSPVPSASGLFLQNSDNEAEYDFIDLNPDHPPSRPPFCSLSLVRNSSFLRIAQSCNGLFLCCNTPDPDETKRNFYVFNPTTNRHAAIPHPPSVDVAYRTVYGFALAFDPSLSPHYKLVGVRNSTGDHTKFYIEVYSSETGEWRPSSCGHFAAGFDTSFDHGVFCNGSVYWISSWGASLRFDLESERMLALPKAPVSEALVDLDRTRGYFAESGGHLHFVNYLVEPGRASFDVYEMERDYSQWFVRYNVDISEVIKAFPEMVLRSDDDDECVPDEYMVTVLGVIRCEVEEDSFLVMNVPGKVLRYNLNSGSFIKLCDIRIEDVSEIVLDAPEIHQYIESLACV